MATPTDTVKGNLPDVASDADYQRVAKRLTVSKTCLESST